MTIKQQGGVFGRNPTFNNVTVDGTLTVDQIVEKTGAAGITLDGVTLKDGNVVLADGKGIDFSATSGTGTSELFDDYEEGTWTPVPADAASGGNTGTAASVEGIYTKIGNTVFVQFGLLNINTTGLTAGNDFYIQGLPYSAGNTSLTSYATGACIPSGNISYTGEVVAGVTDNTSAVRLVETSSGSNLDYVIVSQLTSGASDIWVSLVYRTA